MEIQVDLEYVGAVSTATAEFALSRREVILDVMLKESRGFRMHSERFVLRRNWPNE